MKKLSTVILSLVVAICGLIGSVTALAQNSDTVSISDENLKTLIIETLELSNSDITKSDLLKLKNLDTPQNDPQKMIKDLSGLEFATNLVSLNLDYNKIINLNPIKDLTNLTSLNLSYNTNIRDISMLGALTNLESLSLIGLDEVSDFNIIANFTKLKSLNMALCDISNIQFTENLNKLETAYLSFNKISDISPLRKSPLITLALSNNAVVDISVLDGITSMKNIYLDNNLISDFNALLSMTNLENINVSRNFLSDEFAENLFNSFPNAAITVGPKLDEGKEFRFTLNKSKLFLRAGEKFKLEANLFPIITNPVITWASSDTSVATVDNGEVTLVKNGDAVITAKYLEYTVSCTVKLNTNITDIKITLPAKIKKNESVKIQLEFIPDYAEVKDIFYTVNNKNVSVDNQGNVKGLKAGKSEITVNADGFTKTVKITVTGGVNVGLIIGIIAGVIVVGGGAAVVIIMMKKRKAKKA